MDVGDLVTLSSAARKVDRIILEHKRFFRGPDSSYYGLCSEDKKRFNEYWGNEKMVGLITKIYREPINRYDYEAGGYVQESERVTYYVAWQANPKGMATLRQTRGHLKFVKRGRRE